jgi:hypothetical protein
MRYEAKNMRLEVDPCQSYEQNSSIKEELTTRKRRFSIGLKPTLTGQKPTLTLN